MTSKELNDKISDLEIKDKNLSKKAAMLLVKIMEKKSKQKPVPVCLDEKPDSV